MPLEMNREVFYNVRCGLGRVLLKIDLQMCQGLQKKIADSALAAAEAGAAVVSLPRLGSRIQAYPLEG